MISARTSSSNVPAYVVVEQYLKLLVWVCTTVEIDPLDWETNSTSENPPAYACTCNIINNNAWQFVISC